jgi:hypothetical protein
MIVSPGNYKAVYRFGNVKDSALIEIKSDPRMNFNPEAYAQASGVYKRWFKTVARCHDGMERIKEMRKTIELMQSVWVNTADSSKKNTLTFTDSLSKKLDDLELLFLSPVRKNGGIYDNSDYLIFKIYEVLGYLDVSTGKCSANAALAQDLLEREAAKSIQALNAFIAGDWKKWREMAAGVPRELLPEVKSVD